MADLLSIADLPADFDHPPELVRLAELGLIHLEPWHLLEGEELRTTMKGLRRRYPRRQLVPFAARQDNDDVACFDVRGGRRRIRVPHPPHVQGDLMAQYPMIIEGRAVAYLPCGEALTATDSEDLRGFDFHEDRDLQRHPRLRRVLTTMVRPTPRFYGVLHWSDGSNLEELDQEVASGRGDR